MLSFILLLKISLIAATVLVPCDLLWLILTTSRFYKPLLRGLLAPHVSLVPVLIFYPFYIVGFSYFVLLPARAHHSILQACLDGFFFGAIAYATYDLTNQATLHQWPLIVTTVDLIWGTVLGGITGSISTFIMTRWFPQLLA